MTKSIEELAQGWGIPVDVAEDWVDKMADAPEGYEYLCPNNEPELPYTAIYNGTKPEMESGTAAFTVGSEYEIEEADDFFVFALRVSRQLVDDDGDRCPMTEGALGQFVIKAGGGE